MKVRERPRALPGGVMRKAEYVDLPWWGSVGGRAKDSRL